MAGAESAGVRSKVKWLRIGSPTGVLLGKNYSTEKAPHIKVPSCKLTDLMDNVTTAPHPTIPLRHPFIETRTLEDLQPVMGNRLPMRQKCFGDVVKVMNLVEVWKALYAALPVNEKKVEVIVLDSDEEEDRTVDVDLTIEWDPEE